MLWSHRLSGWNSRPLWGNRPLYFGDVGDFMTERLEEQSFDRCDAAPQFFANYELDVFIDRDLR